MMKLWGGLYLNNATKSFKYSLPKGWGDYTHIDPIKTCATYSYNNMVTAENYCLCLHLHKIKVIHM